MTKLSKLQEQALNEPSLGKEALGCFGVILGSLFLFAIGIVGVGLTVFGLVVSGPWLTGLGIGMATTGLSVGVCSLGFDFDDLTSFNVGFDSNSGLAGWISARGILLFSLGFAVVMTGVILFFFRPSWETWVSAFAMPGLMAFVLVIWFVRRKPTLDDVA